MTFAPAGFDNVTAVIDSLTPGQVLSILLYHVSPYFSLTEADLTNANYFFTLFNAPATPLQAYIGDDVSVMSLGHRLGSLDHITSKCIGKLVPTTCNPAHAFWPCQIMRVLRICQ